MSGTDQASIPKDETIFLKAEDLPLYCPGPRAPLWSMHPRVYIEIVKTQRSICPYCGAAYQLLEGERIREH